MTAKQKHIAELEGQQLCDGRYSVQSKLGAGSMGFVYLAHDSRLETDVVIKVPMRAALEDADFRRRFMLESRLLIKLNHPHIVGIQDVGEVENLPFVVMHYLKGGSLRDRMLGPNGRPDRMDISSLNTWVREVAKALDFCHGQNIIHRDVKPANILYDEHGNAYLSDFGLTKILDEAADAAGLQSSAASTAAGYVVGTPNYVAPELVMGNEYDGRCDQYSLAITVYEVLTGKPPLEGPTASATMVNQTNKMPALLSQVDASIPQGLAKTVQRALAKDPKKRFGSCIDFAEELLSGFKTGTGSLSGTNASQVNQKAQRTNSTDRSTSAARQKTSSSGSGSMKSAVFTGIATRGPRGKVPCPTCQKRLPLRQGMEGMRARCAHCGSLLEIGKNLDQLRLLKEPSLSDTFEDEGYDEYDDYSMEETSRGASMRTSRTKRPSGPPARRGAASQTRSKSGTPPARKRATGPRKPKKGEMVLEEEVFGWSISKTAAAVLGSILLIVVMGTVAYFAYQASKAGNEEEEIKNQYIDQEGS